MDLSHFYDPDSDDRNKSELDSHADTCVAGANTVPLWYTDVKVSVSPFIGEYSPLEDVPIASVATAWDCPSDGSTILLVINEALYFGDRMDHSLLCPNQLRDFGLIVNDVPKSYDPNSTHSIIIPGQLELPLQMRGVISYLETRKPTEGELKNCPRYEITSAASWDPYKAGGDSLGDHHGYDREAHTLSSKLARSDQICPIELAGDFLPRLVAAIKITTSVDNSCATLACHEADVILHYDNLQRELGALKASSKSSVITKEDLARRWFTGLESAEATLKATTQEGMRFVDGDLDRRLRTSQAHLRFPTLNTQIYTDTMFSCKKSIRGYTCAQVFTDGRKFFRAYPLAKKGDAHHALTAFIQDVGIPKNCLVDGAKEERDGEWGRIIKHYHIKTRTTEPRSPWQNRAEAGVHELKKLARKALRCTAAPTDFWCYALEWAAKVTSLTAHPLLTLHARTPEENITGRTPDISEYAHFSFFEWVWYREQTAFPEADMRLARWVGVATDVGQALTYWLLTDKCTIISRSSVIHLRDYELSDPVILRQQDEFMQKIHDRRLMGSDFEDPFTVTESDHKFSEFTQEEEDQIYLAPEMDDFTPETYDEYLAAQVLLPLGDSMQRGEVIKRKRDHNGRPMGMRNANPLLDTREYIVSFPDGTQQSYMANAIAENFYSQIDAEGHTYAILQEIIGHERDKSAVSAGRDDDDEPSFTTKGWKFQVLWQDGTSSLVPLREMKDSFPVQTAEYAVAHQLSKEPAFKWWVNHVLRKRQRIVEKLKKKKYWRRTHKYGIELPKSVPEALEIDARTGTTFWRDAIEKEMKNILPAFKFNDDDSVPIGYKKITCHMIFDVKMVGLVRKARFVAGGHLTDPPVDSVYSSVVTRDSVRIMFLIAALNDLDILGADVQNAYINAKTSEKVYFIAGPEFGSNQDRPCIIVRALYGLKSSGARWRDHMAAILRELGFISSKADPDVWMRKGRKPCGFLYWEYALCYVDDILVLSHQPKSVMDAIAQRVTLKTGSVKPPDSYLGADIFQVTIHDGNQSLPMKKVWAMSATEYVKRAIQEVERELSLQNAYLPKKVETPLSSNYRPELDFSEELEGSQINYYQGLIGVLRWIVELGRIDIIVPVSLLSRYMVSPREGHLQQAYHIFAYLKQFNRSKLLFDDAEPEFPDSYFHECNWFEYYPDAKEPIPPNIPEALGHAVTTTCFVDADHAGCKVTRRSQTGIILYVNKAPIIWYSKRQNTVESATFGSEFIALKTAIDQIDGLRYKLRMFGIPLDGPTKVFCDNDAVVRNATHSESTLRRKHTSIAYHRCREAQAAGYVKIGFIEGRINPADVLTKLLPGPKMRDLLVRLFYWNKKVPPSI